MSQADRPQRIGVMSGGGDCPGLNAVIRAVTKAAITEYGLEVFGIEDGFLGLIEDRVRPLSYDDVIKFADLASFTDALLAGELDELMLEHINS